MHNISTKVRKEGCKLPAWYQHHLRLCSQTSKMVLFYSFEPTRNLVLKHNEARA